MTSLQGYVSATYNEIVEVFGVPTYDTPSGDDKVNTEWEMYDEYAGPVRIYDWKDYDGGELSRSGQPYRWHIGGNSQRACDFIANRLNKMVSGSYFV